MDFVGLAERMRQEAGLEDVAVITTLVSATDTKLKIKNWINEAWRDIQLETNLWKWMKKSSTYNISSATRTYSESTIQGTISDYRVALVGKLGSPRYPVRIHLSATGLSDQRPLEYVEYEDWYGYYDSGVITDTGYPIKFTIQDDGTWEFEQTPDDTYVITVPYSKSIQDLSSNTDAPNTVGFAADYHMLIVYAAIRKYGGHDEAITVAAYHDSEYKRLHEAVRRLYAPRVHKRTYWPG